MKRCILFILILSICSTALAVTSYGQKEYEIIFSETFEGDLSRWEYDLPADNKTIKNCNKKANPKDYEKEYINAYFSMDSKITKVEDRPIASTKEFEIKNSIKTPFFDVEPKKTYTFSYDLNMSEMPKYQPTIEVVFYDEEDNEIDRQKYSMKYDPEGRKNYLGYYEDVWRCSYCTFDAPSLAKKARVEILSPIRCDNVIIVKGFVGFQPEIRDRIRLNIKATDHSDIYKEIPNLILFESFEDKLDEWTHSSTYSKNGILIKSTSVTFGEKSLRFSSKYASEPVGISSKMVEVEPNREYNLAVHMKSDKGRNVSAYLNFLDKNESQLASNAVASDSAEWKEHSISAVAPENAYYAQVRFVSAKGSGEAFVDKVRLFATDKEAAKESDKNEDTIEKSFVLTIGDKKADVFGTIIENDVAPMIRNGRTMLPARFVAENLGAQVIWDSNEPKKIVVKKDDKEILMEIGSAYAYVNGEKTELDSPLFTENDRTYCPVRFISESLDALVEWNGETQQVSITRK